LNLLGIVTPGARLPSLAGNRLLYRDGLPVAAYAAGEVRFLENLEPKDQWEAQTALLRRQAPLLLDIESPEPMQSHEPGEGGESDSGAKLN
jgi:ATP-dependent Lhr-like helicase